MYNLDIIKGGLIDLAPGVYHVAPWEKLWPKKGLVIRGSGYGLTELVLPQVLHLQGFKKWQIANVSITGFGVWLDKESNTGCMENVIIADVPYCMHVSQTWDCHFRNCRFVRAQEPMIFHAGTQHGNNVNNLTFDSCIWENCEDVMLILEAWALKNRFSNCKWHGKLPPLVKDHIQLKGAYHNAFSNCNLTNCGGNGVVFSPMGDTAARDNSFQGFHVSGVRGWGFAGQHNLNDISGAVFPSGRQGRNGYKGQGGNVQPL